MLLLPPSDWKRSSLSRKMKAGGFYSVNRPIVTSPKRGANRLKRQVDWLVNGSLTGPIFSRALNQLTQLEIFPARDKDWPVNEFPWVRDPPIGMKVHF